MNSKSTEVTDEVQRDERAIHAGDDARRSTDRYERSRTNGEDSGTEYAHCGNRDVHLWTVAVAERGSPVSRNGLTPFLYPC
jgi:hypothetical protein